MRILSPNYRPILVQQRLRFDHIGNRFAYGLRAEDRHLTNKNKANKIKNYERKNADDGGGLLYRLSVKTCFGSKGTAGARRVSTVTGAMTLKLADRETHRAASLLRCCRLGSTGRWSTDFTIVDWELDEAQNRVATLSVSEQIAMTISALRHPRAWILRLVNISDCIELSCMVPLRWII
jgi:hypothetical protein